MLSSFFYKIKWKARALKKRAYEHKIISHKDSERSHSVNQKEEKGIQQEEVQPSRRSSRQTNRHNYKTMHTGEDILLNEGQTEVSKHAASER